MDNIKQLKEKIESFITCSDRHCPSLRERYQRHRIKHHSSQKNQPARPVRNDSQSISGNSFHSYGSLIKPTEENRFQEYLNIKEEIMDWSKDLPVYHNPKFEDIKQNAINELIENINNLLKEKNTVENFLDSLKHEITKNVYYMPLTYEQQIFLESKLLQRFELMNGNKSSGLNEENLNESRTKLFLNTVQNSYIDIIKDLSSRHLTDLKLTTIIENADGNSKNETYKILPLHVCESQINKGIIVRNKTVFEMSDYTAIIVEFGNILRDSSVSDISSQRISYSQGIEINAATKFSHSFPGHCSLVYRSEDKNTINSNVLSNCTNNDEFEPAACDIDSLKNSLFNWLSEKQLFLKHNVSQNKMNGAISKISKTLCRYFMSPKDPRNIIYKDVNIFLNKLLKPEFKSNIEVLSNELIERLHTSLTKTKNTSDNVLVNNETQASTCTNIDTDILELSLAKLLQTYAAALREEENILIKEVYSALFKNKIQSMLVSKLCTLKSKIEDRETVASYRLEIDIECIEFLTKWLQSLTREINNVQESSITMIEIIKIIRTKEDDITGIRKSNEVLKKKILGKLSSIIPSNSKIDTDKLANELLQKHIKNSQKSQNRSEAIDNYFYHYSEDIIKQNLKFNIFLKRILREIKFHCLCNLSHTLINNDFKYVKEICLWLNNLSLLTVDNEKYRKKIANMIAYFVDEIKINVAQEDDDSYIKNFIVTLPLNKEKKVNIELASLQLKKRLQHIDKINFEKSMEIGVKEERIPNTNIVTDIEKWCQKLPTTVTDEKTTSILKQQLAWNLLKKFGELNKNFQYYGEGNKKLYKNDVTLEIDKQLNESRLNEKLDDTSESLKDQLLKIFINNLEAIENKHPSEKYVLHLRNLIDLSLRNNANICKEEDGVLLNKIRDVLVNLSLVRQFEKNDDEVTKKYYLFLMEELCAYLQYAKALLIIPFILDPNQELLTYNLDQYQNDQFIEKLLKFIKTKSVLGHWIEILPLQKPNGREEVLHKYDTLTVMADIVIDIEDKYSYHDPIADEALVECIKILPLSVSLQERVVVDLKNLLIYTFKERNNSINPISDQNNSVTLSNYKGLAEHISKTSKDRDEIQRISKSREMKTNHWYSLPPASTITDHTALNERTENENYNEEQKFQLNESSSNYRDFAKGVDLKSSVIEPSPVKRTDTDSTPNSKLEPHVSNYEDFEKGVDFNSSLIRSTHKNERGETTKTADYKRMKRNNSPKELIKSALKESQTSLRKLSSPINVEAGLATNNRCNPNCKPQKLNQKSSVTEIYPKYEASPEKQERSSMERLNSNSETKTKHKTSNNRCVPNCKSQKSSQTSSLLEIYPEKEATTKNPDRKSMERFTETLETHKQENGENDTACNCQTKCLPCYIRRYCKICNSLPLKYHAFHFW